MSGAIAFDVVEDPGVACASMLLSAAAAGGDIVLTGGSTPRAAYGQVARTVAAERIDVGSTSLWFGDERCVAPDDERSNYLMVKRSLLDPLGEGRFAAVHRIKGELGCDAGADDYEAQLRSAGPPSFDLLLLGIGPDGHTASMFPDQASLSERERLVAGLQQAGLEPFVPRVTITLAAIALARRVVVLASGATKADAVAAAFGPQARPDPHIPASMLVTVAQELTVLLDKAAAGKL